MIANPFDLIDKRLSNIEGLLLDLKHGELKPLEPKQPDKSQLWDIRQASDYLHLSVQTVYQRVCERTIPHLKKGKRLYFSPDELKAWINEGKRKTVEEMEGMDDLKHNSHK